MKRLHWRTTRTAMIAFLLTMCATDARAQSDVWRLREELRIGAVDDTTYALTAFYNVLVGATGSLFIPQPQDRQIKVFRSDGRFDRAIGRSGEGPGEFKSLTGIGWRGDTLFVFDASLSRMTLFTATGQLLSTIAFRTVLPDGRVLQPQGFNSDGTLWSLMDLGRRPPERFPELRISRSGVVIDTLRYHPVALPRVIPIIVAGRSTTVPIPVLDAPIVVMQPDRRFGYVIHRPAPRSPEVSTFRISRISERGDTLWQRSYRYSPRPLNVDSVIEARAAPYAAQLRTTVARIAGEIAKHAHIAPYQVPIRAALAAHDGTLWLEREPGRGTGEQWNVLDAKGNVIATVDVPAGATPIAVEPDLVYARLTDDLDVPYLVRYRIVR